MPMPLFQTPVNPTGDLLSTLTMKPPATPRTAPRPADRDRCRSERDQLLEINDQLGADVCRLLEENQALRDAAAIWIRLYERQLARANAAIARLEAKGESA
jgi:hypothetical protein